MNIVIKNKSDLTKVASIVAQKLNNENVSAKHQRVKECIAHSLSFNKFASLLDALPLSMNTLNFAISLSETANKSFADKIFITDYFTKELSCSLLRQFELSYEQCIATIRTLSAPEIFVDQGWGDTKLSIIITNDSNGQIPYGYISKKTYQQLIKNNALTENILQTYKARKIHIYILDAYNEGKQAFLDNQDISSVPYSLDNDQYHEKSHWHRGYTDAASDQLAKDILEKST